MICGDGKQISELKQLLPRPSVVVVVVLLLLLLCPSVRRPSVSGEVSFALAKQEMKRRSIVEPRLTLLKEDTHSDGSSDPEDMKGTWRSASVAHYKYVK